MLAYFDSFAGLIPCRIITAWSKLGDGRLDWKNQVEIVITGTRGVYEKGQRHTLSVSLIVPRTAVRRRKHSTTVMPYRWGDEFARA